ncbi:MAG TPA: TetR/AcrR family transcriptional regulator [Acidimicrobiales bacterium]|nr:TetR/AcrR family transcriptional regulator [Acidimicrobiales bacterium]
MAENKNVSRGRTTRAQLVEVATRLFASRGYDGTSIEAVLAESGVSRGSLYHHFKSKEALFLAVMEDAGTRAIQPTVEALQAAPDPLAALRIAALAGIRLACDPVLRQVMLIDAPAVLGFERWRELDEHGALGILRTLLGGAAQAGRLDPGHVEAFAHLVLGAVNELSLMIAHAEDRSEALAAGERALGDFLDRLFGAGA